MGRFPALGLSVISALYLFKIWFVAYVSVFNCMSLGVLGLKTGLTDCGGHGRFNFCIGSDSECRVGCQCNDGYMFDKVTLKCISIKQSASPGNTSTVNTRRFLRDAKLAKSKSPILKAKWKQKNLENYLRRRFSEVIGKELLRQMNNSLLNANIGQYRRSGGTGDAAVVGDDASDLEDYDPGYVKPPDVQGADATGAPDSSAAADGTAYDDAGSAVDAATESPIMDADVAIPPTVAPPVIQGGLSIPMPNLISMLGPSLMFPPFLFAVPFLRPSITINSNNCVIIGAVCCSAGDIKCTISGSAAGTGTKVPPRSRRSDVSRESRKTWQTEEEERILFRDVPKFGKTSLSYDTATVPPKVKLRRSTRNEKISTPAYIPTTLRPDQSKTQLPASASNGRRSLVDSQNDKIQFNVSSNIGKVKSVAVRDNDQIKNISKNGTLAKAQHNNKTTNKTNIDTMRYNELRNKSTLNNSQGTLANTSTTVHNSNNYEYNTKVSNYDAHNPNTMKRMQKEVYTFSAVHYPTYGNINFKPVKFTRSETQVHSVFDFEKPVDYRNITFALEGQHQVTQDNKKTRRDNIVDIYEDALNFYVPKNEGITSNGRAHSMVNNDYYSNVNDKMSPNFQSNNRDSIHLGIDVDIGKVPVKREMKKVYQKPGSVHVADVVPSNDEYFFTGNNHHGNEHKRNPMSLNNANKPIFERDAYRHDLKEDNSQNFRHVLLSPVIDYEKATFPVSRTTLKSGQLVISNQLSAHFFKK